MSNDTPKPNFNGAMISVDKFDNAAGGAPAPRPNFNAGPSDYQTISEQYGAKDQGGPQSSGNQSTQHGSSSQTPAAGQDRSGNKNEPPPQVNTFDPTVYRQKMDQARSNMQGALYNIEQKLGFEQYAMRQADYDLYAATQSMDAGAEFAARQKLGGIQHNVNQYVGQQFAAQQEGSRAMNAVESQFGPNAVNTQNFRSQTGNKMKSQQQSRGQEQGRHGSNVPGAYGSSGSSSGSSGSRGSGGGRSGGSHGR